MKPVAMSFVLDIPTRMHFQVTIIALVILPSFFECHVHSKENAARPNVVLIMTDDQGYGDLGVTGNPLIRTPNIDAMARRSAWIDTFYVSPVCAPTRACLMTGRYNYRTRCIDTYVGRAMMDPDETTIAEVLRNAGYATGIFGKWHLGDCYPMRPMDQGFEQSLVHRGGGIGQPSDPLNAAGKYTNPILFHNGKAEPQQGYCTDIYYANAISFIHKSKQQQRPFFVYLPDNCPHSPFGDVPEDLYELYREMDLGNARFPSQKGHPLPSSHDNDRRARIFAMIQNIDRNIGHLLQKLNDWDLAQNTIVIFMVDNGPNGRRYVDGMRGIKSSVYEGGIRSPFFVQWPVRLSAGHRVKRVCAHIDVMPTLLEACGVQVPQNVKLDGISFLPELLGNPINPTDRTIVIQTHRGNRPVLYHNFMLRNSRWKLVNASGFSSEEIPGPPTFELYDLQADPREMVDVANKKPEIVEQLKAAYEAWFQDVSNTRPNNYAPPRIHVGTPHETPTVLTRQDWRHTTGRPWQRDSVGHWQLHVADGTYDIRCRFTASQHNEKAVLVFNEHHVELPVQATATGCVFKYVTLPQGAVQLEATLHHGDRVRGIHQADVIRR